MGKFPWTVRKKKQHETLGNPIEQNQLKIDVKVSVSSFFQSDAMLAPVKVNIKRAMDQTTPRHTG